MAKRFLFFTAAIALLCFHLRAGIMQQSLVGKTISPVQLIDGNEVLKPIPYLGEKVLAIFYTDPDVKDVNDPLTRAITANKYSLDKYCGIGIGNCKDTWFPDAAIRFKARQKEEQYPGSVMLLDESYTVKNAWSLGDCDNVGIVIIIGKDKVVKYVKVIRTPEESTAIIPTVLKILDQEIRK